jgi:hypothetical protein
MDKARVYLETTMFSFYYEKRLWPSYQKYKAQVRHTFDLIKDGKYQPYTSTLTMDEINNETSHEKRGKMWQLVTDYGINVLPADNDEVKRLAALYIQEEAISSAWVTDATHIAITTFNGLDFIVSLNFTHIARPWTIERVRRVNMREGYNPIGIYRPLEVLDL